MRGYRDGDRIFQNSLVFIIFCYSFDNRFILSFLGNHYSLTFQFWLFIYGNQHQTPICRSQNLLRSVFPCNGSMSVYTSCSNSELVLIHEACTIAFTKLGGANMMRMCSGHYVYLFHTSTFSTLHHQPSFVGTSDPSFSVSSAMGM